MINKKTALMAAVIAGLVAGNIGVTKDAFAKGHDKAKGAKTTKKQCKECKGEKKEGAAEEEHPAE